ncbi:MAG: DNA-processing protein DprA [Chitinophagales bacterium]
MNEEEKIYFIALGQIPGIGSFNAKQLISYCGGVEAIFKSKKQNLLKIPGVGPSVVNAIFTADRNTIIKRAEKEIQFCEKKHIDIVAYHDHRYPTRLNQCKDAPYLLYVLGDADLNAKKMLSIVGTRRATNYGKQMVEAFVEELAPKNVSIVSGLAYGIDSFAHKYALEQKLPTIGVLAHGLHTIYPSAHRSMAEKMVRENGALITEFKSETKPDKQNFPSRNRIVAGMCDGTLVVESAEKGGALITAYIADSYNRDVFAIPGKVNDKYSSGCNALIKKNVAAMVESGEDIIQLLGWDDTTIKAKPENKQRSLFVEMDEKEQIIYNCLERMNKSIHIDELNQNLELSNGTIFSSLLSLELKGMVTALPGNCYQLA